MKIPKEISNNCPDCASNDSYVLESRIIGESRDLGHATRRNRVCRRCAARWPTYEISGHGFQLVFEAMRNKPNATSSTEVLLAASREERVKAAMELLGSLLS
jgi:transcriptional regulator NrdR family protein